VSDKTTANAPKFRFGRVALIGQPNAGKSTLLNRLLGSKLAITSAKPQTTRHRIAGVFTTDRFQAVLLDTPGIHEAWTELNKVMVDRAISALSEADVVCLVGDMTVYAGRVRASEPVLDTTDERILAALERAGRPVIFVANKIDVVDAKLALPVIDEFRGRIPSFAAAIPLSALTGDGVDRLVAELAEHLLEGEAEFDPEQWTDLPERFLAAEIVREKIFHLTEQEIPYSTHVEIVSFDESERETRDLVKIHADVVVERSSQKAIVIGKGGEMLKRIGTMARKEIQELLGCRVYLELFVKVEKDWTRTTGGMRRVGFG
jgi:GTP-binding protein Era